jgi:hypothetical protein
MGAEAGPVGLETGSYERVLDRHDTRGTIAEGRPDDQDRGGTGAGFRQERQGLAFDLLQQRQ